MRFTWHDVKRSANLRRHGIDLAGAEQVFDGPTFTFEDTRENYGERRWVTIRLLATEVVVVVHTETEDAIRVISIRKAERNEERLFFDNL